MKSTREFQTIYNSSSFIVSPLRFGRLYVLCAWILDELHRRLDREKNSDYVDNPTPVFQLSQLTFLISAHNRKCFK
jgi:hypothetical protein